MEPVQVAEIRSKGWSYRAEMYPVYRPSYVGAAPLTKYFVFNREWKEVPYNELPRSAYQALRRALKADIAKGPMRDPQGKPMSSVEERAAVQGKSYGRRYARARYESDISFLLPRLPEAIKLSLDHTGMSSRSAGAEAFREAFQKEFERFSGSMER